MRKIIFGTVIFLMMHNSLLAQSSEALKHHIPEKVVYAWEGKLTLLKDKEVIPVLLQYQAYDSIPGPYHKQLIVGDLKSARMDEHDFLVGYVENQRDISYHFYLMSYDGHIEGALFLGRKYAKMEGYWLTFGKKSFNAITGVFSLMKKDTSLLPQSIETTSDKIFGNYIYNFGTQGPRGVWEVDKNADGTANIKFLSIDKTSRINIEKDSVDITKTSFILNAKYKDIIYLVRLSFYKGFVLSSLVNPHYKNGWFGKRATVEGFFIKTE